MSHCEVAHEYHVDSMLAELNMNFYFFACAAFTAASVKLCNLVVN